MNTTVDSASDQRIVNNTVRHAYRVLSDGEKAQMQSVKDKGLEFLELIESLRTPEQPYIDSDGSQRMDASGAPIMLGVFDRELNIAAERVEEAVMWAVKHITR